MFLIVLKPLPPFFLLLTTEESLVISSLRVFDVNFVHQTDKEVLSVILYNNLENAGNFLQTANRIKGIFGQKIPVESHQTYLSTVHPNMACSLPAMRNMDCQHCGKLIVGKAYRVTSENEGIRLLDMIVCSLCFLEAKRLGLHAAEINVSSKQASTRNRRIHRLRLIL